MHLAMNCGTLAGEPAVAAEFDDGFVKAQVDGLKALRCDDPGAASIASMWPARIAIWSLVMIGASSRPARL
jgi:hypothetical protein